MMSTEFLVSLARLPSGPGSCRPISLRGGFDSDVVIGLVVLPAGRAVAVEGTVEAVGEGVLATARVRATLDATCSRCLTGFSYDTEVELRELFVRDGRGSDDEESRIHNDSIDLADVARDAIVLDAPLIPLCAPDCAGLCQSCGADLNADPDHCHEEPDPRWLGLGQWGKMS